MTAEDISYGRITVAPRAIATLVVHAILQSYGVVGLAPKNLVDGITHVLVHDPRHGVEVKAVGDQIVIDVFIMVEYGTRISSVATSVANTVRYHVERALGMPVGAVNVHVQDLHVSDVD